MRINSRFEVDPLRNKILDKQTGKMIHVEPRMMKLLCLLTKHHGEPVTRKMIIKEIWDDYPGGDEGLNQAISVLRKLLSDDKRRIIETVPKTGYCFHGTIENDQITSNRQSSRALYVGAALVLVLILGLLLKGYYNLHSNKKTASRALAHEESIRAFNIDAGNIDSKIKSQPVSPVNTLDHLVSRLDSLAKDPLKSAALKDEEEADAREKAREDSHQN